MSARHRWPLAAAFALFALMLGVLSVVPAAAVGAEKPRNVSVTASGSSSGAIEVSWDAPETGSPTGYRVIVQRRNSEGEWGASGIDAIEVTNPVTQVVDGLTNGATYRARVRAVYNDDVAEATSGTAVPYGRPGAPEIADVVAADGSVDLAWTAPNNNGRAITSYVITAVPGDTAPVEVSGSTTATTVEGLTNEVSYTFTVRASNLRGDGPASASSAAVTPQAGQGGELPPGGGGGSGGLAEDEEEAAEEAEPGPGGFTDVSEGSIHGENIATLVDTGITQGCDSGRFCPTVPVTREQMATFLVRALELPTSDAVQFDDVGAGSTHAANIQALADAGITLGCDAGRFCPRQSVERAQMATFLTRGLALEPAPSPLGFVDVGDDHRHVAGIGSVASAGISEGCGDGRFCPEQPVTRQQMATFLVRALDL